MSVNKQSQITQIRNFHTVNNKSNHFRSLLKCDETHLGDRASAHQGSDDAAHDGFLDGCRLSAPEMSQQCNKVELKFLPYFIVLLLDRSKGTVIAGFQDYAMIANNYFWFASST